jgi:hypothetical protein
MNAEQTRIDKLMRLPSDTRSPTPPPRGMDAMPQVYRPEPIKCVVPQRPLDLEDEFIDSYPLMAAALTTAQRMRMPFELLY